MNKVADEFSQSDSHSNALNPVDEEVPAEKISTTPPPSQIEPVDNDKDQNCTAEDIADIDQLSFPFKVSSRTFLVAHYADELYRSFVLIADTLTST